MFALSQPEQLISCHVTAINQWMYSINDMSTAHTIHIIALEQRQQRYNQQQGIMKCGVFLVIMWTLHLQDVCFGKFVL